MTFLRLPTLLKSESLRLRHVMHSQMEWEISRHQEPTKYRLPQPLIYHMTEYACTDALLPFHPG